MILIAKMKSSQIYIIEHGQYYVLKNGVKSENMSCMKKLISASLVIFQLSKI